MPSRVFRIVALGAFTIWALPSVLRAQSDTAASGQTPPLVRHLAGCYQLTMGAWSGSLPAGGPPAVQRPPAWFALDSAHFNSGHGARARDALYAVQPSTLGPRERRPASWPRTPAYWQPVGADSASIAWSNGYLGVTLRVAVRGDSLIGRARTFQDAQFLGEPPAPEAPVVAVRATCPPGSRARAG